MITWQVFDAVHDNAPRLDVTHPDHGYSTIDGRSLGLRRGAVLNQHGQRPQRPPFPALWKALAPFLCGSTFLAPTLLTGLRGNLRVHPLQEGTGRTGTAVIGKQGSGEGPGHQRLAQVRAAYGRGSQRYDRHVETRQLLFEGIDNTALFRERRQGELHAIQLRRAQRVKTTRRLSHSKQLRRDIRRVPQQLKEFGINDRSWSNLDQVILVNGILDRAVPCGSTANLIRAPITFNDEQVTVLQAKPIQFPLKQFNLVNVTKVKTTAPNVGHAQEREFILHRAAFGLLLDSPSHVANLVQLDPSPPCRKLSLPVHAHTQASS